MFILNYFKDYMMKSHFISYMLSFFIGFMVIVLFYSFSGNHLLAVTSDLNERFGVPLDDNINIYTLFYLLVDYVIYSLTITSVYFAINKNKKISCEYLIKHGFLASVLLIISHQYLLSISYIGTYYLISFVFALFAFVMIVFVNKSSPVTHKMYTITTMALYIFLIVLHIICVYGALFNQLEKIEEEETKLVTLMTLLVQNNSFDLVHETYPELVDIDSFTWDPNAQVPLAIKSQQGLNNVIRDMNDKKTWRIVFNFSQYKRTGEVHVINEVWRNDNSNVYLTQYKISGNKITSAYFEYYKMIYYFIIAFVAVWLSGLFKLLKIHKRV